MAAFTAFVKSMAGEWNVFSAASRCSSVGTAFFAVFNVVAS